MNVLLCSVPFEPSIGGIETVSQLLADEFAADGVDVTVVTQTPGPGAEHPYPVLRRPSAGTLLRAVRRADVVLHSNVSLRLGWPLAVPPARPWVVAHHVWTPRGSLAGRAKHATFRFARNTAVSAAIARSLDVPAEVIPNPYDDRRFRAPDGVARDRDVAFLGRLVSDKGAAVLVEALDLLRRDGRALTATIVGHGPEERALRAEVAHRGLGDRVTFAGALRDEALVHALARHRFLAVPSVWEEPFGVVALEGLACGLVPVVSRSGGLPDAVGDCGLVVPSRDARALADALARLDTDTDLRARLVAGRAAHLAKHTRRHVAQRYLAACRAAVEGRGSTVAAASEP